MSHLLVDDRPRMDYVDRRELLFSRQTEESFRAARQPLLDRSPSVYVGNLTFFTTEEQVRAHFGACGPIRDVVMGLNEQTRTPCGFCFVVYERREAAALAVQALSGTVLDDRVIRVSWDVGADHTRRWGRGAHGGQVVDSVRQNLDEGRGGLGALRRSELGIAADSPEGELQVYGWVPPRPGRRSAGPRRPREEGGDGRKYNNINKNNSKRGRDAEAS